MFLRHKQRPFTAIAMGGVLIPSRGIAGALKNDRFMYGAAHWDITGATTFAEGRAVLGAVATLAQVVTGFSDGEKLVLTLDVISITGSIAFTYAGGALPDITATGVQTVSVTAGTTNIVLLTSGAAEAITLGRITVRHAP